MSVITLDNSGVVLQVFDLIDVLLDAPISKLLIVTGVIFLLVAVLGRIPGWPDAGERGQPFNYSLLKPLHQQIRIKLVESKWNLINVSASYFEPHQ